MNDDEFDDIIIGLHQEPVGPDSSEPLGGKAYVIFGSATPPAQIDLGTLEADEQGFVIIGAAADDHLGFSVSAAGNVDQAGGDDLVLGAIGRFPGENESPTDGKAYVVFGKSTFTPVNLGSLGAGGFVLLGEAGTSGEAGVAVTGLGDWNADGFADVAVSATKLNDAKGRVYVVYGKANSAPVDLAAVAAGDGGFAIDGENDNDQAGRSLCNGGDLGGSSLPDLIIGVPNPAGVTRVGKTYVLYGRSEATNLALADVAIASSSGALGFAIEAEAEADRSGLALAGVGDFDDDGRNDLLIGANEAGATVDGAAYLIFGEAERATDVHLLALPAGQGLVLRGEGASAAHLGFSASRAGDMNADGYPDFIIGAPQAEVLEGRAYVLFGHP